MNAVEFCTRIYKLTELSNLADAFMAEMREASGNENTEFPKRIEYSDAA